MDKKDKLKQMKKIYKEAYDKETQEIETKKQVDAISKQLLKPENDELQKKIVDAQQKYSTGYSYVSDNTNQITGQITFPQGTYYPGTPINPHHHTVANPNPVFTEHGIHGSNVTVEIDSDEFSDLIEMLEVEPGGDGLIIRCKGKDYSMIKILRAQVEMMVRMNIFLMHRLMPDDH